MAIQYLSMWESYREGVVPSCPNNNTTHPLTLNDVTSPQKMFLNAPKRNYFM